LIKIGETAPDFTLKALVEGDIKDVTLSDYRGRWVVLFSYPADFTFICPTEVTAFNENLPRFQDLNTAVLGVSTDSVYTHRAWVESLGGLGYPLLSDFNKVVARMYDILVEEEGFMLRSTFIIDPDGVLRYALVHDTNIGRSVEEILRSLAALQAGGLTPCEWKPGEPTVG